MGLISRMRKQTAVYWSLTSRVTSNAYGSGNYGAGSYSKAASGYDDYGQPILTDDVVEIECRWVNETEEFIDAQGTLQMSNAKVYVDRNMVVGEVLMLGDEDDITETSDVKENVNAYEIRKFERIPNLRATEYLRVVYM